MSRSSHLLLSLLFCFLLTISFLTPRTKSQSTLRSLPLNGTTASVDVPNSTSLNITGPITVEAWIKYNAIDGNQHDIVSRINRNDSTSGGGYSLGVNTIGKLRLDLFQNYNSYTTVIGTTVMSTGVWHHVAGVFNGSQMRVYVDGLLDGSLNTSNAPGSGTSLLRIGKAAHPANTAPLYLPSFAFAGLIDEVRVSAVALYTSNFTPGLGPGSNVRGLWKFDGQTADDFSGSGNHGALQTGATYSTDVPTTSNSAPSVSLVHPLNNTSITAGSTIVIDATASDTDGSVTKVDFYQGTTLLGTDTAAPYEFVWTNVSAGTYSLTAKATDDATATTTSTPIAVTVVALGGNNSLSLNGTTAVDVPNSTSLNITGPITIEAWIKYNATDGNQHDIVSRINRNDSTSGGGYSLGVNAVGKLRLDLFQNYNSYTTVIGTTVMSTGVWHHVAGVFNGSQMRVYVDGVLDGSLNTSSAPGSGTSLLRIGKAAHPANTAPLYLPSFAFAGLIDEVRVSAVALYTSNFTPGLGPGSNVRGLWKFDGQTADDFSGSGNHGALQTGATYSTDVPVTGSVGSQRPVPKANGSYTTQLGQAVQFSSSGSADPDGTLAAYHWNFGDSTSATTANASHTYTIPGLYIATLTVTDNAGLLASATATVTITASGNARLDPISQTGGSGENPLSRNFNWTLPLLSLPGRAGMDLNLSLSYNSLVWTKTGSSYISFDDDHGFPGPGFRLGFPVIQPLYYNAEVGKYAFLLISGDGSRTELRRVGTSPLYEAADSSYLLLDSSTMMLRATDGTQLKYEPKGSEFECTEIKDRNGNYITVNYTSSGRIATIVDTLERSVKFNYDANGLLTSITQMWNQVAPNPTTHNWAIFEYSETTIQTNFTDLIVSGPSNGAKIKTLSKVTLADGSHHDFSYTNWGQIWKVSSFAADNHLLRYRSYKLPGSPLLATGPQVDCPRFTERRDWAENWNQNASDVEQEAITAYAEPVPATWTMPNNTSKSGTRAQVTTPDGTVNKIYFMGTATSEGWRRALPALVETYSNGNLQRQVMTTWTQDNETVSYSLNPRITETNVYDPAGNRKRVRMTYQQATFTNGTSCQLLRDVYEYGGTNADTILRSTRTDYHANAEYSDRRIIGLVTEKRVYEGDVNGGVLMSKVGFFYDNENSASSIQNNDAPVQHDNTNYSPSFTTGRANLSSVRRYNVTNIAQFTTTRTKYNTAGAVVSTTDASGHTVQVSYIDSFSDNVSRNTLAYQTTITDPDGYTSTTEYNFDLGAVTYRRLPEANATENRDGAEQVVTYDEKGRLQQITNQVNGSYTRYVYASSGNKVETYATFQAALGESYSFKVMDGAGRVIAVANEQPGSLGGYSGQKFTYDVMARLSKSSNPTETSAVGTPTQWTTTGDDENAGWIYKQQTYDWKGRPLVTTNADGVTTKTASYSGCGCAGGAVMTLTDEGTLAGVVAKRRQQKIYTDVLGRTIKTETLNWQGGSVYLATVNTFNARDQITRIRQYAGGESSGTYQDTTMTYDSYGRLSSRHLPEQDNGAATVWAYNADDTLNTVTDARGAVTTFDYTGTGRHLVKTITDTLTGRPTITVSFDYDALGNRTSMTDSLGSAHYAYNQLSQLTSETRTITGVGSFTLDYTYNLGGQLSSITDPFGALVSYNYDKIGRLTAVNGANFGSISTYASNLQYRAWGALKSLTYGNSKTLALGYDVNLNVSSYEIPGLLKKSYEYYDDGRLKFTQDQLATNSKFDRLYKYDHVGRISSALSGAEARGQGPTDDRPYQETMSYDPINHLTMRELRNWNRYDSTGIETYTNNRRQYWQYDADGRLLSGNGYYTYDAAGQISSFGDDETYITDQQFDGDGRRIKSAERNYDPNTDQWITGKVTYYIHSSVVGEVISEVDADSVKERSFVFADRNVIAVQSVGADSSENVSWQHYDASGASHRSTNSSGIFIDGAELDPMGADAGLTKPLIWPEPTSIGKLEPYYGIPELNSTTQGCLLDRVPIPCDIYYSLLNNNAVQVEYVLRDVKKAPPKPRKKDQPKKPAPTALTVVKRDVISRGLGIFFFDAPSWDDEEGGWDWEEVTVTIAEHKVDLNALKSVIGECVHELWPEYEMLDYKPTTRPGGRGGRPDDDKSNGTLTIRDVTSGAVATIVNDPTPPPAIVQRLTEETNDGVGATDTRNPWWNYTVPEGRTLHGMRNAEKRYPELFLASGMDYVRIQLHESGASLSLIRHRYHPGPWANPSDNGLYPSGHMDDGPAMEDCVGRKYYQSKGLTPNWSADLK